LQASEPIAVWLEAIALIAIFFLDWKEKKENRKERREQHKETAAQLQVAQSQAEATKMSADAAIEAAMAAKKSAEIAAALHSPLIGLESQPITYLSSGTLWIIPVALRNHGTLPATHLNASFDFHTESPEESRFPLQTINGPESAEIPPHSAYETDLRPALNDQTQSQIASNQKILILTLKTTYNAPDGRKFEYTAEARLHIVSKRLEVLKSETRSI
jgi:hypothetical protein